MSIALMNEVATLRRELQHLRQASDLRDATLAAMAARIDELALQVNRERAVRAAPRREAPRGDAQPG